MAKKRSPPTRPMGSRTYGDWLEANKRRYNTPSGRKYQITGTNRDGRRFSPINTNMPANYNVWTGTIWEIMPNGQRRMVQRISPGMKVMPWWERYPKEDWRRTQHSGNFSRKTGRWQR